MALVGGVKVLKVYTERINNGKHHKLNFERLHQSIMLSKSLKDTELVSSLHKRVTNELETVILSSTNNGPNLCWYDLGFQRTMENASSKLLINSNVYDDRVFHVWIYQKHKSHGNTSFILSRIFWKID